ncbi:SAV_915 family protein [Streptomyces coeruleoprunus]|uniref:SAV_915 family protein n=1 Tax=Streptomyces coeruleoprunus TaxID=285563 RepID=A0ABV9XBE0_9ACTN
MTELASGDDPEPSDRVPAGPLFVPVRPGPAGHVPRLFRTPLGERTAVGFTTAARLTAVLGRPQPWIRLGEPALRSLTEPLGVTTVTVDPQLIAPPADEAARPHPEDRGARPGAGPTARVRLTVG